MLSGDYGIDSSGRDEGQAVAISAEMDAPEVFHLPDFLFMGFSTNASRPNQVREGSGNLGSNAVTGTYGDRVAEKPKEQKEAIFRKRRVASSVFLVSSGVGDGYPAFVGWWIRDAARLVLVSDCGWLECLELLEEMQQLAESVDDGPKPIPPTD